MRLAVAVRGSMYSDPLVTQHQPVALRLADEHGGDNGRS